MNNYEYYKEINEIAENLVSEVAEEIKADHDICDLDDAISDIIFDSRLHETIDGHQWVIYYAYHQDVLHHSSNTEYGLDEGLIVWNSGESSYGELTTALTYWAMYADVSELISDKIEEYVDNLETEAE